MLFRKSIEKSCAYCRYGGTADEDLILCSRRGLRTPDDKCWRFTYDPYKRIPHKEKALDFSRYDADDFTL